jgi:hypothetical protein
MTLNRAYHPREGTVQCVQQLDDSRISFELAYHISYRK